MNADEVAAMIAFKTNSTLSPVSRGRVRGEEVLILEIPTGTGGIMDKTRVVEILLKSMGIPAVTSIEVDVPKKA